MPSLPTRAVLLALGACALAGAASDVESEHPQPGWLFASGFQEGSTAVWDGVDTTVELVADPGPFGFAGNTVARFRAPPGQRGGAGMVKVVPSTHDRLYARWYMKFEAGFNFSARNHGGGLHGGSRWSLGMSGNVPTDWFTATIEYTVPPALPFIYTYYQGMYQDNGGPDQTWGDSFPFSYSSGYPNRPQHRALQPRPALVADRWYCVEQMIDAGTPSADGAHADGRMCLWYDGRLIGAWNDLWWRKDAAVKPNLLWLSLFHHDGTHSIPGEMFDDVVISGERIGPYVGSTSNRLPVVADVTAATPVGVAAAVTLSASDPDGDALTYEVITPAAHGTVTPANGRTVTYTPAPGYTGTDTFLYRVFDGRADGGPGVVTMTIGGSGSGGGTTGGGTTGGGTTGGGTTGGGTTGGGTTGGGTTGGGTTGGGTTGGGTTGGGTTGGGTTGGGTTGGGTSGGGGTTGGYHSNPLGCGHGAATAVALTIALLALCLRRR
jgi:hypothetical protein